MPESDSLLGLCLQSCLPEVLEPVSCLQEALGGSSWQRALKMSLEQTAPGQGHGFVLRTASH